MSVKQRKQSKCRTSLGHSSFSFLLMTRNHKEPSGLARTKERLGIQDSALCRVTTMLLSSGFQTNEPVVNRTSRWDEWRGVFHIRATFFAFSSFVQMAQDIAGVNQPLRWWCISKAQGHRLQHPIHDEMKSVA